uniref:hypothetical protein n=1 Tax=Escherichia coli TaxID=562 RepID=UPI00202F4EB3|nr:hypothetical protein [Escherichia coli]
MVPSPKDITKRALNETFTLVSLVSSVVIGFSLSGCAGDTGTTPGTALNAYSHGQYWHAKANDSVAKNAYSFAGSTLILRSKRLLLEGCRQLSF